MFTSKFTQNKLCFLPYNLREKLVFVFNAYYLSFRALSNRGIMPTKRKTKAAPMTEHEKMNQEAKKKRAALECKVKQRLTERLVFDPKLYHGAAWRRWRDFGDDLDDFHIDTDESSNNESTEALLNALA